MGSKSPEEHQQTPDASNSVELKPANLDPKISQSGSNSADLDQGIISDEDEDGANEEAEVKKAASNAENKKKRKRSKKKKTKSGTFPATELKQTSPPRVLLSTLFPSGYPAGELVPYEKTSRTTDEESRYNSRLWDDGFLADYRQGAEIHRQVRQYAQKELIKPGRSLLSIAEGIESGVRALSGHQGLPIGNGGKDVLLQKSDVLKVDIGVHVNGRIVDSAFTIAFDHAYDNLLAAVKEATNTGTMNAGVDARMSDIGAAIQEVMESYEVDIAGKFLPVKTIRNLAGHNILRYHIHGLKQVPIVKSNNRDIMEEGEVFAIETFGSTGRGFVSDELGIYGYRRKSEVSGANLHLSTAKALLKTIDANFGTLVFCRRYLELLGVKNYHLAMRNLMDNGIVESYAPLADVKGSYTAQFEHTILIHSGGKEVISRGDDY